MRRSSTLLVLLGLLALTLFATPASVAAPPLNDNFADATVVTGLPFSDSVSISEATTESGEPLSWWGQSRTVWYSFTPTSSLVLRVDAGGSDYVSAFWSVYRQDSSGFAGLNKIASGSYTGSTVQLEGGKTYYIQGGDDYPYGWVSTFGLNLNVVLPPANDNFADASAFTTVPFSDSVDLTAATVEPSEPTGCGGSFTQSAWYAFTPTVSGGYGGDPGVSGVNVYTGTSLTNLKNVACSQWWGLAFHADAGTTYYLQYVGGGMRVDLLPPPDVSFSVSPGDPSVFDDVSFSEGGGYWNPTKASWDWNFGDGTTGTGSSTTHRFKADGDYTVTVTVTTVDGRTNSQTQTVQVRTHDVTILSLVAPGKGQVGKQGTITVGIGNTRYSEQVQVDLYRVTPQGDVLVGTSIQTVGVMKLKKTVSFKFMYVFTPDDLALGKVPFKAVATIQGARDAISSDNVSTSPPTLVTK